MWFTDPRNWPSSCPDMFLVMLIYFIKVFLLSTVPSSSFQCAFWLPPADVFPALTLPAPAMWWSLKAPAYPLHVWPWLAENCWLWLPSRGLDSSGVTQDNSEKEQTCCSLLCRHRGYMCAWLTWDQSAVCSCDSIWDTTLLWAWQESSL